MMNIPVRVGDRMDGDRMDDRMDDWVDDGMDGCKYCSSCADLFLIY